MLAKSTTTKISNKAKKYRKDAKDKVDIYEEKKNDPKYKTELCKSYNDTGFCPYGNKCRFAHGKQELFQKENIPTNYRKKKCISFHCNFYCVYGNRCLFKHHDDLKDINRSYYYTLMILQIMKYKDGAIKYINGTSNVLYIRTKRLKIFEKICKNEFVLSTNQINKSNCNYQINRSLGLFKSSHPKGDAKISDCNTENCSSDENLLNYQIEDQDIVTKHLC